jgi:enoyl-CoA hydratase/carnithine racemase
MGAERVRFTARKALKMGLIRKTMSLGTVGIVSYRSKEERATKFAKQTRNAARAQVAQTAMMLEQQRQMVTQGDHAAVREEVRDIRAFQPPAQQVLAPAAPPPAAPPAGFYNDPFDPSVLRWFDGAQWTAMTKPAT